MAVEDRGVRRRAILSCFAGAGVSALFWPKAGLATGASPYLHRLKGQVFDAGATILMHGMNEARAQRLAWLCREEINRLEDIFSLYRPGSSLSRLNADGRLLHPPEELVVVLQRSIRFSDLTDGAFDVTVQPLWRLYAQHFSRADYDPAGPGEADRNHALALVDYSAIDVDDRMIAFARPGMAITLNGIAQGVVTDRIVDLLRGHGVTDMYVELGESRAQGLHPKGRPWRIGLVDPSNPSKLGPMTLALGDEAVASSGGYGMRFDPAGHHHHLFDRFSGKSAVYNLGVTVRASNAATADALSTALSVMPHDQAIRCLRGFDNVEAIITMPDGSVITA